MKPYKHTVQYYETDRMGFAHHSNYIRWMEEVRSDFFDQIKWPYVKTEEMGIISPVVSLECKYKHPTTYADVVSIEISVEEVKRAKFRVSYVMKNQNGDLVCEAASEHCFLDKAGNIVRMDKQFPEFYADMLNLIKQ
ncbi:acyl-CoA thioesterase [Candidatus Saccharibacteria bacterium]|nr:acyl-CoA thioesterase [Candidatus Saccharibacteria bacterium]